MALAQPKSNRNNEVNACFPFAFHCYSEPVLSRNKTVCKFGIELVSWQVFKICDLLDWLSRDVELERVKCVFAVPQPMCLPPLCVSCPALPPPGECTILS